MAKHAKKRLRPSSPGEASTSTSNPPASQDASTRSSKAASTAGSVPAASSRDLVGDIVAKSAVAPAVDTLRRKAPGKHTQVSEDPSASTSRSAGPARSKKPPGRAVFTNAAGKPAAAARGPASTASRRQSQQTADGLPSSCGESGGRTMKRRACSDHSGPPVLRPAESLPTRGPLALQGAPVLAFSGDGPGQPQASDAPIEDAEMEDLSDVIDENLQNQVPLADQKGTFVITDTNIFLNNLNLVKRLTALDSGPPDVRVCIPWMAIQELDHIKNCKRGSVTRSAVAAIAFINEALVTKNPKFRGQTIAEARTKDGCVPQDLHNNDDHFIHCCVVVMNTGNRVLLLSNDVNLRNKGLINNVQSFSAAELEAILDREFGSTQAQPGCPTAKEPAVNVASTTPVPQHVACAEVREILRRSLSLALESELQSAFGDLWPRVVAVKPPWTEETALACILKHWIALTGMAFKSSLKKVVENLLSALRMQRLGSSSGAGSTVLRLSLQLCSELQLHYYPLAGDVARLRELHHEGLRSRPPDGSDPVAEGGAVPRRTVGLGRAAGAQEPSGGPGLGKVVALCDDVWHVVNDYCGFLAAQRGVEYRFPFQARRGFRYDTPVQLEALRCVTYVLEQFEHLLKAPYQKRKTMVANTTFCLNAIKRLVEVLNYEGREPIRGTDTTPEEMALYFADPAHDVQLRRGVEQLCYMHQSVGYSTIDAIGSKPVLTAKK
ncbi:uncharacterized protein LOC144178386 isoform X4 [Haemaphysalis longicornis]